MRTIRKIFIGLVIAHIGAAFVALTRGYHQGLSTTYGMDGWLAVTPLSAHSGLDLEASSVEAPDVSVSNVPGFFQLVFDLGDTVNSIAVFNYPFLAAIGEDNALFILVLALRLVSFVIWIVVAGALITMVLRSGLLASQVGLVVLFGGVGILSVLGIVF